MRELFAPLRYFEPISCGPAPTTRKFTILSLSFPLAVILTLLRVLSIRSLKVFIAG